MHQVQQLAVDRRSLLDRRAEPAVAVHLGLQRTDPLGPLGMARDVVGERGVVTQPECGHAGTVRPSVNDERSDLVVVGAGAAGLFACLCAAREGARVVLVSARPLAETASYWAQGGLAAALTVDDSPARHLQDTLTAGRGLVRRSAAAGPVRRGARTLPRPRGARRPLRRRPPRQRRPRPRGRPRGPPGRARGRERDRPPDPAPALGRGRRAPGDRGPRGRARRAPRAATVA